MTTSSVRKFRIWALAVGTACALSALTAGCGSDPAEPVGGGSFGLVTTDAAVAPEIPTSGQVFREVEAASSDCGWDGMQITGVRVGRHETFDRVVFDLSGEQLPCYRVLYEANPVQDGSGFPIDLGNHGAIRVEIPQLGPEFPSLEPGYVVELNGSAVTFARFDTFFEGTATSFIATTDTVAPSFAVSTYPGKLVIDVETQ